MRMPLAAVLIAAMLCAGGAEAGGPNPAAFKVGVATRQFVPPKPYDWRRDPRHALRVTVWYPAAAEAAEQPQLLGPPGRPLFDGGRTASDASLAPAPEKFPLIVLSHGTGGTAGLLAWLGTALASHGYVAAAVDHPGNNAIDGYTVPGFTLWWLRARDLSAVIDGMLADRKFGPRLDPARIGAAGHSLGGYTVIAIAGGITSLADFRAFCGSSRADAICRAPPEFPDLVDRSAALAKSDAAYRVALADDARPVRDARVQAVFAMAPALGQAFAPDSLGRIDISVAIVAGAGDRIAPAASNARWLAAHIPGAGLTILPAPIGHYVFVNTCRSAGRALRPQLCDDPRGVDRRAILAQTAGLAEAFFARHMH